MAGIGDLAGSGEPPSTAGRGRMTPANDNAGPWAIALGLLGAAIADAALWAGLAWLAITGLALCA